MANTAWSLPRQTIREVGTKAADLFDLLLAMAVGGVVRGVTISRITASFNAAGVGERSERAIRDAVKKLEQVGLIEIERFSLANRDADLQHRGDLRIRVKKTEGLQGVFPLDTRDHFRNETRYQVRHEPPPDVKPPEKAPIPSVMDVQPFEKTASQYTKKQEAIKKPSQQEPASTRTRETADEIAESRRVAQEIRDKFAPKPGPPSVSPPKPHFPAVRNGPELAGNVVRSALSGLIEKSMPSDLFDAAAVRERKRWEERLKPYFDFEERGQWRAWARVVCCIVDLKDDPKYYRWRINMIERGEAKCPAALLNAYVVECCSRRGLDLIGGDLDAIGKAATGKGISPPRAKAGENAKLPF